MVVTIVVTRAIAGSLIVAVSVEEGEPEHAIDASIEVASARVM